MQFKFKFIVSLFKFCFRIKRKLLYKSVTVLVEIQSKFFLNYWIVINFKDEIIIFIDFHVNLSYDRRESIGCFCYNFVSFYFQWDFLRLTLIFFFSHAGCCSMNAFRTSKYHKKLLARHRFNRSNQNIFPIRFSHHTGSV